jgi:hypothetical protein
MFHLPRRAGTGDENNRSHRRYTIIFRGETVHQTEMNSSAPASVPYVVTINYTNYTINYTTLHLTLISSQLHYTTSAFEIKTISSHEVRQKKTSNFPGG